MKFNELRWQLAGLNGKMDSVKSTIAAVVAKELAPHNPTCNTPVRATVPVVTPDLQVQVSQEIVSITPQVTFTTVSTTPPTLFPATSPTILPATSTPPIIVSTSPHNYAIYSTNICLHYPTNNHTVYSTNTCVYLSANSSADYSTNINVNSCSNEMLDPTLTAYVKAKSFEFFHCQEVKSSKNNGASA